MIDSGEITPELIIDWAIQYASYEELEKVSKGLYGIYAQQRKNDYPKEHREQKAIRKIIKKQRAPKT